MGRMIDKPSYNYGSFQKLMKQVQELTSQIKARTKAKKPKKVLEEDI